jgi:hypothetical protein
VTAPSVPEAATAEHLTEVLRQDGALGSGCACDVEVVSGIRKLRSHTFRVRLGYQGPAANPPTSVILKKGHLDSAGSPSYANRRELAFYQEVAPALPERLVPHYFEIAELTEARPWHLLLEDLTESHFIATEHPLPPTFLQCKSIVQAWGRLHAALWDDPRLDTFTGCPANEIWAQHLYLSRDQFARFIDRFGEVMPAERRGLYERLLDSTPYLLARYDTGQNLTLIHGDAHWWNCLLPHDRQREQVRILDWEDWTIGTGTTDLAYMIAMLWFPDRRRSTEQPLLTFYHDALLAHSVTAYTRQQLNDDYRRAVLLLMLRPIWQATHNLPARVWWPNLERNMLAVEDLDCRELLG